MDGSHLSSRVPEILLVVYLVGFLEMCCKLAELFGLLRWLEGCRFWE
jgi:hypothetical protein